MALDKLVLQQGEDTISVADDEVPVIFLRHRGEQIRRAVVWAVNFLRSGCPAVQFLMDALRKQEQKAAKMDVESLLRNLELGYEHYSVAAAGELLDVLVITREVRKPQETSQ